MGFSKLNSAMLSIVALLVVSACEHAPADSSQRSDAVVMLQPSGLRSVPQANLRARILIDNTSYELDAADAVNGGWRLPLVLEVEKMYSLLVTWHVNEHLCWKRSGQ